MADETTTTTESTRNHYGGSKSGAGADTGNCYYH
jgi:hypothetical protein